MSLPALLGLVLVLGLLALGRRMWKQSIEARPLVCSDCQGTFPAAELRTLPLWNEPETRFDAAQRCAACFATTLAETRHALSADPLPEPVRQSMLDFLRRHEFDGLADSMTTPEQTRTRLLHFLDRLENDDIVLDP